MAEGGSHGCLSIPSSDLDCIEEIGSGGFGVVYRANWISRHEIVAVKRLLVPRLNKEDEDAFLKEISFMQNIRFPHIITFYGACIEPGNYALVMEYMPLGSLYKILHKDKLELSWIDRLSIAYQATKSINHLHKLPSPILHRDIKSLNFLLSRTENKLLVKVCDFGLAQLRSDSSRQTKMQRTVPYALQWTAPEILDMKKYTEKSDVYSLAVVFWELVTCELPYDDHPAAVISDFVSRGKRLEIPPDTPSKFAELINDCWTHDPKCRPDCLYIIKTINECLENEGCPEPCTPRNDEIKVPVLKKPPTPSIQKNSVPKTKIAAVAKKVQPPNPKIGSLSIDSNDRRVLPAVPLNAKWVQEGETIVSGCDCPQSFFVDDDLFLVYADYENHRILELKVGEEEARIVAGGNGLGNELNQLNHPIDVLVHKGENSYIICDWGNRRVLRWPRNSPQAQGEVLVKNITPLGFCMDDFGNIYISNQDRHEVRQYQIGDDEGVVVAGGRGKGTGLDRLHTPYYVFVDQQQNIYVSDYWNHRVIKWIIGATQGVVVAGGCGKGSGLNQLQNPMGIFVDMLGTVYVADSLNHRVMRWPQGAKEGIVIAGGNGHGQQSNQFDRVDGLCLDRHGTLYVVDKNNHRIQRFSIK